MENDMISKIREAENACKVMEEDALRSKKSTIEQAHLEVKRKNEEFAMYKREQLKKFSQEMASKNRGEMQKAMEESKHEIEDLRQKVSEKKNSAITMVMSLIS